MAIERSLVETQATRDKALAQVASLEFECKHLPESIVADADVKLGQVLFEKDALCTELAL